MGAQVQSLGIKFMRPPPVPIANAAKDKSPQNAVIKVIVLNGGKVIQAVIERIAKDRRTASAWDAKAGYAETPADYTWHHSEDLGRMYLVPLRLHKKVNHTGGVATYKQ